MHYKQNIGNKSWLILYFSFTMTFVTLFWSLFGLIVPDNIQSSDETSEYLGKMYFGAYMIIAAILLINILIAMINNTYKKVIVSWIIDLTRENLADSDQAIIPYEVINICCITLYGLILWSLSAEYSCARYTCSLFN